MAIEFSGHNIRLDNGVLTKPEAEVLEETHPWFLSAARVLNVVFPSDRARIRVADLGCLEGGYAVGFARMGFQVLGLEVRDANMAACRYVKANTNLPNLEFVQDDAWNLARYGVFDVVFCCGLLYHLDRPRQFIRTLSAITTRLLLIQTHFSVGTGPDGKDVKPDETSTGRYHLSPLTENESLPGRWFTEYSSNRAYRDRENAKWSAWDNRRSFWIQREYLLHEIQEAGFDLVMEQFDSLGADIGDAMTRGYYKTDSRGMFIGIKTRGHF
jgi:hypothetical protein